MKKFDPSVEHHKPKDELFCIIKSLLDVLKLKLILKILKFFE